MSKVHASVLADLNSAIGARVESLESSIKNLQELQAKFTALTEQFLRTGIVQFNASDNTEFDCLGVKLRGYFRELCRELDRPYIVAETNHDHVHLQVPDSQRTHNIIAPLVLSADGYTIMPRRGIYWLVKEHPNKMMRVKQGGWHFYFIGKAKERFDQWMELCRTDPVFRIVLKTNT